MTHCFIALGGNLGFPLITIKNALAKIKALEKVDGMDVSGAYLTSPVSPAEQNWFVNAACKIQTTYTPEKLFQELSVIERELGKVPKPKEAPRIIDIDLLFYDILVKEDPELTLPHPRVFERAFVLVPMLDLTETLPVGHPQTGEVSIRALLQKCQGNNQVIALEDSLR